MDDSERIKTVHTLSALLSGGPRGFVKETRAGTRIWSACVFAAFYNMWRDAPAARVVAVSMLQSYDRARPLTRTQQRRLKELDTWIVHLTPTWY